MPIVYPTTLDTDTELYEVIDYVTYNMADHHNSLKNAVKAIETKIGINNSADTTSLDYKIRRKTVTTVSGVAYTANENEILLCNATSNNILVSLPIVASSDNLIYQIKKIDSSANTITISGNANIDGDPTLTIRSQYDCVTIICNGTAWYIV